MIELLKNLAIWLVATISVFGILYGIGSFCVMSLDITTWTSNWGRFGLILIAAFAGGGCLECVHDARRIKTMSALEREKERDLRRQRHSHADY